MWRDASSTKQTPTRKFKRVSLGAYGSATERAGPAEVLRGLLKVDGSVTPRKGEVGAGVRAGIDHTSREHCRIVASGRNQTCQSVQ